MIKIIITKVILLFGIVIGIVTAVFAFLINRNINPNKLLGYEVYDALDVVEQTNSYEKVLLGDSVSRQLCPPESQEENQQICYLSTNQAITIVGNYILLCRYLENNPQTKQVIYMVHPFSLTNHMRADFSYQYFILPFYQKTYVDYIDESTREMVIRKYGSLFVSNPVLRYFLRNSSVCLEAYLERIHDDETEPVPDMTFLYLGKMQELCGEYGAEFVLVSSPLNKGFDYDTETFLKIIGQTDDEEFRKLFERYIESMHFYEKDCFSDDVHFTKDYLEKHREELLSLYPELHDTILW